MTTTTDLDIAIDVSHAPTLNFAMEQCGVPVISGARVSNRGGSTAERLRLIVRIEPDLAEARVHEIGDLRGGESIDLSAIDLQLRPGRLRTVLEAERAELHWEVQGEDRMVTSGRGALEILAYDEWAGLRAPPALLATFVTPNDPVVTTVLRRVRDHLRVTTGDGNISGYQTRSPERVRAMVRALYETIQGLGLSYIGVPASYESSGQKIRLAEAVLSDGLGNCLDLSVLVASSLEQMGLSPLIIIQRGHAFPGVWLTDDRFHEGVVYDAARLRNAVAIDHLLFFDSSTMVHEPRPDFDASCSVASRALTKDTDFLCAIDIAVARRDRYRPLPLRDLVLRSSSPAADNASENARSILDEAAQERAQAAPSAPDAPTPPPAPPAPEDIAVAERFRRWREKLLDLSLRNKLLNFRKDTKGVLPLDVTDIARLEDLFASDQVFDIDPRPRDARDERDQKLVAAHGGEDLRRSMLETDLGKGILHSPLEETAMLRTAIHLDRESRTAMEEGGSNVLYVAVGLLKWFESGSSTNPRFAPLLLVPVKLEYTRTTRRVRLRRLQEDSLPNWTLLEKVNQDFGVDLRALAQIEADENGLDVPAMLRGVREAIQAMPRWEVIEEAHLGLFSFAKYLMWRDLIDNSEVLLKNDVIRHIATKSSNAFAGKAKIDAVAPARLDDDVPPAQLPLVVDADSTQTAAVVSALRGRSFVLQGPPGTGKSQTITNLIATSLAQGKTVLFVSEKMAALNVVYRRLQGVGLGDFCLELHSHKAQKKEVIGSLGKTMDRASKTRRPRWDEDSRDLAGMQTRLNEYVRALHAPTALGWSFHEVSAKSIALASAPSVPLALAHGETLSREQFHRAKAIASTFSEAAAQVEPVARHPFRDVMVGGWSAQHDQRAREAITQALAAINQTDDARRDLCTALGVDVQMSIADLRELTTLTSAASSGPLPASWRDDAAWTDLRYRAESWKDLVLDQTRRRTDIAHRWKDDIFTSELADLVPLFERWSTAFFLFAWLFLLSARRRLGAVAARELPGNRQIASDLALAKRSNEVEEQLVQSHRELRRLFDGCGAIETVDQVDAIVGRGEVLRSAARNATEHANPATERAIALAANSVSSETRASVAAKASRVTSALAVQSEAEIRLREALVLRSGAWPIDGETYIEGVRTLVNGWNEAFASFRSWCLYQRARGELVAAGYGAIAEAHAAGTLRSGDCEKALERALLDAWLAGSRDATPVLRDFSGRAHDNLVDRFQKADRGHLHDARGQIAAMLEERLPRTGADASTTSEPGILRRELAKKTRHLALRKLLQQIPNLLVRLKPCLLMSPLSVAQYLPAGGRKFDIVVFDEASQICTHDAIGAIGRGEQVVVVGDSKQLPPTAFFKRAGDSDDAAPDENDFVELESILDEALASGLPEQMLEWHYRSRHEALIEFSNRHYYDNRLNVFPAARGRVADLGVKFHKVEGGVYESGKSRTNPKEAQALVDMLVAKLRTTRPEDRTFGVVTFSSAQQEHVEELLNEARARYPEIEPHFKDEHPSLEKVFIKNLENVQGDERDEVFFSIAYGPDHAGKMIMNFGPVNRDGGERRLNVAVTRARKQLRVFASITHAEIDTNRARGTGARHLKAFLQFAAERDAAAISTTDERAGDFDSDFERDVYDELRAHGYKVETQVGCGAYRIDLAVVHPQHPGVYALGIECDGAAYHSGATARDRDRLRQEVLEGLGWRLHRIWSTDWIYDRRKEIERLVQAIDTAITEGPRASSPPVPEAPRPEESNNEVAEVVAAEELDAPDSNTISATIGTPYRRAELVFVSDDPDQIHVSTRAGQVKALIEQVLAAEAPIHVDELAKRVAAAFSAQRVGARIKRRVLDILSVVPRYTIVGDFVWSVDGPHGLDVLVRSGGDRDTDFIPREEIAVAARAVLSTALSLPMNDLLRETARVFGIQRRGLKVEQRMRRGVDLLADAQLCAVDGERVTWVGRAG